MDTVQVSGKMNNTHTHPEYSHKEATNLYVTSVRNRLVNKHKQVPNKARQEASPIKLLLLNFVVIGDTLTAVKAI